jgi:prepilin-type N-terminal cleavage/methylation domain-containing protein
MLHVSRKGFTIIELLVAMGIFVVITSMVVANFRTGSQSDELKIAAEALVSNLRKAQNMALAGQLKDGASPPGGYGVYFKLADTDRYIIFADLDGRPLDYDVGEALSDGTVILPRDVRIINVEPTVIASVVFKPPKPTIYINGGTAEATLAVTLKHNLSGQTRRVVVKRISGQIGIE